ncbi:MAG: ABC transporter ATP-binding protein [Hyphomicrobiaceae bacterium]
MTGVSLEVEDVAASYGAVRVLAGVSLQIEPGEFMALLGSSGCGKTTLLRSISGFVPIDTGRIKVAGRDVTGLPPEKRDMAMVFQSYALWPHMTVAQNIGYGLKLRRVSNASQRVDEMLALLDLSGLGNRNVTALSGGQRQRVALGRALAINPKVLLLDEPLSNLDARIRQNVRHEIKELQVGLGITTIHVTHDREEAMVMADRIVILEAGEIAQIGTPEDVYNRPNSPFVATFMGADNILSLRVERRDDKIYIPEGSQNLDATLPMGTEGGGRGVQVVGIESEGMASAHFRSEAASLSIGGDTASNHLILRGEIVQSSYPGGYYRYTIVVGDRQFMVDHPERLPLGQDVNVCLPAAALHLYPAASGSMKEDGAAIPSAASLDRHGADHELEGRKIA